MFYDTNELTPDQLQQAFAAAQATANNLTPQAWQQLRAEYPRLYQAAIDTHGQYPVTAPEKNHKEGAPLWTIEFMYRRILVHCPIMPETVRQLQMQTRYLTSSALHEAVTDRKAIGIYYLFDSPGGSVDYGLQLFDDMLNAQTFNNEPVFTIIESMGASMGSLLPQAASFGCRFMRSGAHSNARQMIHNLLWGAGSQKQAEHERGLGETREKSVILYNIYLQRIIEFRRLMLGETINQEDEAEILEFLLRSMEEQDSWMTPAEAMEHGLTDFSYFDEGAFQKYRDTLLWYHGFAHYGTPEDSKEERVIPNPEKKHVPLDEDEQQMALEEIRRLRNENYDQAKELEAGRVNPAVARVKDKLSDLQNKQGSRPYDKRDITLEACREYVDRTRDAVAESENNDNDDE